MSRLLDALAELVFKLNQRAQRNRTAASGTYTPGGSA